jgi:hypothetical protein
MTATKLENSVKEFKAGRFLRNKLIYLRGNLHYHLAFAWDNASAEKRKRPTTREEQEGVFDNAIVEIRFFKAFLKKNPHFFSSKSLTKIDKHVTALYEIWKKNPNMTVKRMCERCP